MNTIADRLARVERSIDRLEKAIKQVNDNEAERYRMTRDCLTLVAKQLHKPRKQRRPLRVKEPPFSSWNPG